MNKRILAMSCACVDIYPEKNQISGSIYFRIYCEL